MAVAFLIELPGMTQAQADAIVADLNLGGKPNPGQIFHVEGTLDGVFQVVDVWESREALDAFMQSKLVALFQKHGITGQPTIRAFEAHNILK